MRVGAVGNDVVGRAAEFVRTNPEVVAAVVVGFVVTVAVTYAVFRYRRPMGVLFKSVLADREELSVLMHPNPDPDAMAAAIGVATLADQLDVDTTLQFSGQIRHQENRAFRTVLDLELDCIDHVSELSAEDVLLVDHNSPRGFAGAESVLPLGVVDHHPGEGDGEAFTDVRTDYGATASIVAEYFQNIGAKPVPPDQHASEIGARYTIPSEVATGLLYGILADTNHLTTGCDDADFAAAGYLYPGVDEDLLDRIANPQVSAEVLEVKARAIAGRKVQGSFAVSDVGGISNVDAVPQAADELMQLEGVTAVVVCGERDGMIYLSGRSRDDRVHMGRALEAAVSDIPNASAGGHARMGGGQIPERDEVDVPSGDASARRVSRSALIDRLFDTMSGDV